LLASFTANESTTAKGAALGFTSTGDFATSVAASVGGDYGLLIYGTQDPNNRFLWQVSSRTGDYAGPTLSIDYTPVPEPGTYALSAGLGALALMLGRRKLRR